MSYHLLVDLMLLQQLFPRLVLSRNVIVVVVIVVLVVVEDVTLRGAAEHSAIWIHGQDQDQDAQAHRLLERGHVPVFIPRSHCLIQLDPPHNFFIWPYFRPH